MGCFDRSPQGKSGVNVRLIHCEHTFGAWWVVGCSGTYFKHAQTCDNVCVQSATQWTASVHTLRVPKPVITFMVKVLRNGLLRYTLHMPKPVITFVFKVLHTLHMLKPVITFVFKVLRKGLLRYILYTCPNLCSLTRVHTWTALIFETFDLLEHVCIFWHQF